jgi:hypothetical protein
VIVVEGEEDVGAVAWVEVAWEAWEAADYYVRHLQKRYRMERITLF